MNQEPKVAGSKKGKVHDSVVQIMTYNEQTIEETQNVTIDQLPDLNIDSQVCWINVDGLGNQELITAIANRFHVHGLLLEDIFSTRQRPKLEGYNDVTYIVAKILSFDISKKRIVSEQLSLVLGKSFLLSFQEKSNPIFDAIRARIRSDRGRIRKMDADYLAHSLLDSVVDQYLIVIEALREHTDTLQTQLLGNPDLPIPKMIHNTRIEVANFRRAVFPLQGVLEQTLKSDSNVFHPNTLPYLRDVHDHILRVLDQVDAVHFSLNSIIDAYLSLSSQRMNEVMKVLTIFSTIFLPLTFIAGVYGMNFRHMPELEWPLGYPFSLGLMVVTAIGLFKFFRHKKWL